MAIQTKTSFKIHIVCVLFLYFIFSESIIAQEVFLGKESGIQAPKFTTLVWADEFDGQGVVDSEKWFHQTLLPHGGSWWGGLIQHYTDREDNSYLRDGFLHLVAKKEQFEHQGEVKPYTSVRLNSKFAFTYGRIEVKAKLPAGKGTWPAIWMLNKNIDEDGAYWDKQGFGTTKWPLCGEIDIMEHWGKNQDYLSSALHNGSSYGDDVKNIGGQVVEGASDQFHIYSLEWTKEKMVFCIDGVEHLLYQPSVKNTDTWPYDSPYYIILNIAIEPDIDPAFIESAMVIDYVRVYQ